jgi:hypothetical protein
MYLESVTFPSWRYWVFSKYIYLFLFVNFLIQFVFRRKQYKTKQQWPTQSCWCSPGRSPSPEPTQTMNLSTSAWRYLLYIILWRPDIACTQGRLDYHWFYSLKHLAHFRSKVFVDFLHYVTKINCLTGATISETHIRNKYI